MSVSDKLHLEHSHPFILYSTICSSIFNSTCFQLHSPSRLPFEFSSKSNFGSSYRGFLDGNSLARQCLRLFLSLDVAVNLDINSTAPTFWTDQILKLTTEPVRVSKIEKRVPLCLALPASQLWLWLALYYVILPYSCLLLKDVAHWLDRLFSRFKWGILSDGMLREGYC